MKRPGRRLTADEAALWARVAQTVVPQIPLWAYNAWVARGVDWLAMSEDLPRPENRVTIAPDGRIRLQYRANNMDVHRQLVAEVIRMLKGLGFYLWHPALERRGTDGHWLVLDGLREFREHLGGELTITLLRAIGQGEEVHVMDEQEILQAIGWLRAREAAQ